MFLSIVGTSRCGTTILRKMLHSHPDLRIFRETHWIPRMIELFAMQRVPARDLLEIVDKTTWDTGQDLLSVNLEFSTVSTRKALVEALQLELNRFGGQFTIQEFHDILARVLFGHEGLWGDKTPDYGYYMTGIQSLWPKCRFVHIVRDGLATAQSMSRHSGCQLMISGGYDNWCELSYDGLYKQYDIMELPQKAFIQSWCRRMSRIRDEASRLTPGSYLEVRYEDLVNVPIHVLESICSFLGLDCNNFWLSKSSKMVKKPKPLPEFTPSLFETLEPEDIRVLQRCREDCFEKRRGSGNE